MILEGDFFFQGIPRWNLGWPTPNYAGAFLVTAICFAWAMGGGGRWRLFGLLGEAAGYFLLAKTYSRGALIALVVAALFFLGAMGRRRVEAGWRVWIARAAWLVAMVFATGLAGRIQPQTLAEDGAVLNRLELWRGGLKMIAAAPLRGWGAGESGRVYMNWFQDVDRTEEYTTMVNSFLHVAVDHGLLALGAGVLVAGWLLAIAWSSPTNPESLSVVRFRAAAGAVLVAWSVTNIFSTLWIEPRLWVFPTLAALGLVAVAIRARLVGKPRILLIGMGSGALGVLEIFLIGQWLATRATWTVNPLQGGAVELRPRSSAAVDVETWHIWSDRTVLGPTPGKELRRWILAQPNPVRLVVHRSEPTAMFSDMIEAENVILLGAQSARLGEIPPSVNRLWLIHPTLLPPNATKATAKEIVVLLPELDEVGSGSRWRFWAEATGACLKETPFSGQDLRAAWPAALASVLETKPSVKITADAD